MESTEIEAKEDSGVKVNELTKYFVKKEKKKKKNAFETDDALSFLMQQKRLLGNKDFDAIFRKPNIMGPSAYFKGNKSAQKYFPE